MREVEVCAVALMNPEDAAQFPTGMFCGCPIVPDPDMPQGFGLLRMELPPDVVEAAQQALDRGVHWDDEA